MSSYIDSGAERSGADVPVHYLGARPMADCCVGRQMQRQQFPLAVDFGPGGGPMGVEFAAAALPREEFILKNC